MRAAPAASARRDSTETRDTGDGEIRPARTVVTPTLPSAAPTTTSATAPRAAPFDAVDTLVLPIARDRPRRPAAWSALRRYSFRACAADAGAGITAALVALPIALALAMAAGLPPQSGLFCAIISSAVVALFGGSRTQIAGPGAGVVLAAAGIWTGHGIAGLTLGTMMAGLLLIALGGTGLGAALRYLPRPIVFGWMNGLSLLLASTQIAPLLGLAAPFSASGLVERLPLIAGSLHTIAAIPALLGLASLLTLAICHRRQTRLPASLIALMLGTAIAMLFGAPVETIATHLHPASAAAATPALTIPTWPLLWALLPSAFAIAIIVATQSLLSAEAADRITGDRHDANVELMALGLANAASPLFGGLPASGSQAQTLASVQAGARTPVAGLTHALTLLAVALFFTPLAGRMPLPVLAALLLALAWQMGGWRDLRELWRLTPSEIAAWLATMALTLFADLPLAAAGGLGLGGLLFIRSMTHTLDLARVSAAATDASRHAPGEDAPHEDAPPPFVATFRIDGPFVLRSTDALTGIADRLDALPPIVILRLCGMTAIDAAGLRAIAQLGDRVRGSGRAFLIGGMQPPVAAAMTRARLDEQVGRASICASYDEALACAGRLHRERFQPGFPYGSDSAAPA